MMSFFENVIQPHKITMDCIYRHLRVAVYTSSILCFTKNVIAIYDIKCSVSSQYQLYPDFNIDVAAEQAALARADLVIWQHPMQWYSVPPLLKLWMDKVLSHGWAYGHNGIALRGKSLMWAVTTGGGESHFDIGSFPGFPVLAQPLQATALYCGMKWLPPFAMHCTFICDDETLQAQARHYRQRLIDWQEAHHNG